MQKHIRFELPCAIILVTKRRDIGVCLKIQHVHLLRIYYTLAFHFVLAIASGVDSTSVVLLLSQWKPGENKLRS